jgi:hypothetical protein
MKNIEQQLEDEKRRSQAIIDLLDEALVKIGLDPNSYTVAGKIDMLVKYAQQGVHLTNGGLCAICNRPEYSHAPEGHDFRSAISK